MLFFRSKPQAAPATETLLTPELRNRVAALQARNTTLRTAEDAVASAQEAGALVTDLLKSVEAMSKPAPRKGAAAPAPEPVDDYDPDRDGFDPESADDGGDDPDVHAPEGDDPGAMPAPRAMPTKGKSKWAGKFAKSIEALSQGDVSTANALAPVFGAIESAEQNAEVTGDYLEQIGGMLSKSLEGMTVIAENQHRLAERLDSLEGKLDERTSEIAGQLKADSETLHKSFEPYLDFLENQRKTPVGTPVGRVAAPDSSIASPLLGGSEPVQLNNEERFNGFSRSELKKSIEGAVRSGRYADKGLSVLHFNLLAEDVPLSELPPVVFEVASTEMKRPLPAPSGA